MIYLASIIVVVIFIELFRILRLSDHTKALYTTTQKSLSVMNSKNISDHWKEIALPIYAKIVLFLTLKLFVLLILVFGFALLPVILIQLYIKPEKSFLLQLIGWDVVLLSIVFCALYYKVRAHYEEKRL